MGVNIVGGLSDIGRGKQLLPCYSFIKAKWCDCFTNIPNIYLLTSVFDSRCKLHGLKNYLEVYYTCLDLKADIALL